MFQKRKKATYLQIVLLKELFFR
uniref:Uncharacterized protein n=1 Tax=Arundo donax TaxID=35708 RepID=A0A0A8XTB8_ARUDO